MEVGGIIESNWDEVVDNFDAMNLKEKLLRGIYAYGFEKPSAIQQRAIIPCIRGRDVIAQAQSGKSYQVFLLFSFSFKNFSFQVLERPLRSPLQFFKPSTLKFVAAKRWCSLQLVSWQLKSKRSSLLWVTS